MSNENVEKVQMKSPAMPAGDMEMPAGDMEMSDGDMMIPAEGQQELKNQLDKIAYFVIFPQNTKLLDDAIAIIPNEVAKKAVLDTINSVLVPVTKEQLEEAQNAQTESEAPK